MLASPSSSALRWGALRAVRTAATLRIEHDADAASFDARLFDEIRAQIGLRYPWDEDQEQSFGKAIGLYLARG